MKWLYPYAIKIITNSEQCRLDLLNLLKVDGDQIIVIKNAIDIERILELNKIGETLDKPTMGNDFVTIGRLSYQKNYPAMLRIFSSLLKEIPGSRLFIVGNGEERDSLITLAESLGLRVCENRDESGEVFFLGFQENPYQFISKDSVFLLTSHYEGLPNVLLEAMACGSFIVSSDCKTGPKEILEGTLSNTDNNNFSPIKSNGLLLPVPIDYETEKVWTREIKKVLKNTMLLKEIRNNAQVSSYNYHHDKIIKAWENLIHS
ncbi:MAG: glycosyltransferase [Bdellovibrionota bacterium]|nr:glycosyltransferase [Bdellovibrionota bacterium]